jgi:ParB family chromosome partitioning protein
MTTTTKPSKGLGKGLSALISENYVPAAGAPATNNSASGTTGNGLSQLAVNQLFSGKYQPRTRFDEGALTELAESIEKNGIMQPIIVRPSSAAGRFEIIAGERRWRAAKIAGLQAVPVIIREITDKQALELALVENIQRQDLSPLEEASGYQRLIEEFEYTQEALASVVGKSRSHVANMLRLLTLPVEVKAMLDRSELTMGHARALLNAPDPIALAKAIVAKGLNVRQAEQASREVQGNEKRTVTRAGSQNNYRNPVNKDPDILALEESLSENLGLRVSMNDRGQSGEIIIAYDNLSQLDVILRKLGSNAEELV